METLSNTELIRQIQRYQHNIQQVDPPENDAQRVLHYIRKLSRLPIRFQELEKTGIGKTINALRKRQGNIGEEATLLVAKWKAMAKKQVQEEEESSAVRKRSDADSHSDYESPGSEKKSNSSKDSKKIRVEVQKSQSDRSKEIKLKSSKHTDKPDSSSNSIHRKRKHSTDREKFEKNEKYIKLEPVELPSEEPYIEPIKKESKESKSVKEEKHYDSERKKKKEKEKEAEKPHRKEHDKKHHKSSKHKEDKAHRHHSKSSHTEKKRDSKSDAEKHRSDKKSDSKSRHDSEKKSSSSSRKDSKSSSKHYSPVELSASRNDQDSDGSDNYDNYDNTLADDDFGAALLGIPHTASPVKKKSTPSKYSSVHSSPVTNSPQNSGSEFDVLSGSVKLEPLDDLDLDKLKEDSYASKEDYIREKTSLRLKHLSEEEALNSMTTTKNQRTKVFSGCKSKFNVKFPSLFELCVRVLQDNFDALEYTGGVPYDVLKPILEKVTVEQLYTFENYNPYLIGETDELWEYHGKRHFRSAKRQELETWRDVYLRCVEEREEKLQSLTENISQSIANSTPVRKTKLAYFDSVVKPPRNVARSQAKHGTGHLSARSPKGPQPSPAAVQSVKERLAKESMGAPQAVGIPSKNLLTKKKKAPLMQKTLQLFKGLKR